MSSEKESNTLTIRNRGYRVRIPNYPAALLTLQNPIIQRGEIVCEQDTLRFKIGNGTDRWNNLDYVKGDTGPQGPVGPYFTPSVDLNGDISWTNNGGLVNPMTRNIKGPQGDIGYYFTPSVAANGDISWTNNGSLPNPQIVNIKGPQGDTGPQGPVGLVIKDVQVTDVTGVISVTVSASIATSPTIKNLIGGLTIEGTWTGSGTSWVFTPSLAETIFTTSWIITLPAA